MKRILTLTAALIMLAACSTVRSTYQPALSAASTASQTGATNHAPVILGVVERKENKNGELIIYKDISFSDAGGDATTVVDNLVWSNQPVSYSNVAIMASSDEQKSGAMVTDKWGCYPNSRFAIETRILDRAGNFSEPEAITISCPLIRSVYIMIMPFLIIGLGLLVGAWPFFRHHPSERVSALQSTFLLFLLLFPVNFMYLLFHEGGHALANLPHGGNSILLFAHPFSFSGYIMPVFDWNSVWFHAAGAAIVLPASLLVSMLFWKRRSVSNLPFILFFPWAALMQGIRILTMGGDFQNIKQITGLPAIVFIITGALIVGSGIFCLVSLLPLLGLAPQERKSLFVLPAGVLLWSVVGGLTAYLLVPGSPIAVQYYLAEEILKSANNAPIVGVMIGVLLAVIYIMLYRRVYPRLPVGLQTETVTLAWRDLRIPALLSVISVILGIIIII